jgi:hypothetical protein
LRRQKFFGKSAILCCTTDARPNGATRGRIFRERNSIRFLPFASVASHDAAHFEVPAGVKFASFATACPRRYTSLPVTNTRSRMHHAKDSAGVVRRESKWQRHGEEIEVIEAAIHQNLDEQASSQAPKIM